MTESPFDSRRIFLKRLAAGLAASGGLMMVRQPGLAALVAAESPDPEYNAADHEYAFFVDVNKCIGCGYCVQACQAENDVPDGQFRTWVERYVVTAQGVHVDSPKGGLHGFEELSPGLKAEARHCFFVPKLCNHCANAPCVQVCPVGATFRGPGGFVLVDPEHCIGCSYCVKACPYGARFMNRDRRIADKCTWCYHRVARGKVPACVEVCPTEARLFGDLNNPQSRVAKLDAENQGQVLKPDMHTDCQAFYLNLPRQVI
jgi:Fe-S-cluster-containing dehydrogenase component